MRFLLLAITILSGGFLGALFLPDFRGRTAIGARIYATQIEFREWARARSVPVKIGSAIAVGIGGVTVLWWPLFLFGKYKPFGDMITDGVGNTRVILTFIAAGAVAKLTAKYL